MLNVAVLITCCNQKEEVLQLLADCLMQIDKMKKDENYNFSIYVLDNNSTDGTFKAISDIYPKIKLFKEKIDNQWGNGLNFLWEKASLDNPNLYLIINCNIRLKDNALFTLTETSEFLRHKAIVVGSIYNFNTNHIIYGGVNNYGNIITPDNILPIACTTFDAMLVLIPKFIYEQLGLFNPIFKLKFGDRDYGIRALKHNLTRVIAPGVLGNMANKEVVPIWNNYSYPLKIRIKAILNKNGYPIKERFIYDIKRKNIFIAIWYSIFIWLKVLFPIRKNK